MSMVEIVTELGKIFPHMEASIKSKISQTRGQTPRSIDFRSIERPSINDRLWAGTHNHRGRIRAFV